MKSKCALTDVDPSLDVHSDARKRMQFAVHLRRAKLSLCLAAVAGIYVPLASATNSVQAASSANVPVNPADDSTMTRTGYKEDQGDLHATMEVQSVSATRRLVVSVRQSDGRPPSLDDQARLVDVLLQRVRHDHPDIADFDVMFGSGRESLLAPLNNYLAHSPEWNPRTGRPRHGQLGPFLTAAFNLRGVLTPLQKAFEHNDLRLSLDGVGRIDIEKSSSTQGALLPLHIDLMYFKAKQISK